MPLVKEAYQLAYEIAALSLALAAQNFTGALLDVRSKYDVGYAPDGGTNCTQLGDHVAEFAPVIDHTLNPADLPSYPL